MPVQIEAVWQLVFNAVRRHNAKFMEIDEGTSEIRRTVIALEFLA